MIKTLKRENRLKVIIPTFALSLTFATPSLASDLYFSGFIGASILNESNITSDLITDEAGLSSENGILAGIALGASLSDDIRGEIEASYRSYDGITIESINNISIPIPESIASSDLTAFSLMGNIYYDLNDISDKFTPFFTGGLGISRLSAETEIDIPENFGGGTNAALSGTSDEDDIVFAYQLGIGGSYRIDSERTFVLGYRYVGTGDANFDGSEVSDISSHEIYIGFRFPIGE